MSIELLIALIPILPLVGFLFAVLVGPGLDNVPTHATHGGPEGPDTDDSEHGAHAASHGPGASRLGSDSLSAHGVAAEDHSDDPHGAFVDDRDFRSIPTEEEQRLTSPHYGHADDLANAEGAQGVIPPELDDGLGQAGHVTAGAPRPTYRSWLVPTALVGVAWLASMVVFASVIFGGNEYEVTLYEWIVSGDFRVEISFMVDALTAMLLLVVSTVGFLVHVYSIGYMDGDRGFWRFFAYLNLFMFSMLLLILADNFLLLYVGWEAVGLCSYALIGYWYKKPSAAGAAKKAFVVNRVGDFGFALGIMLIWVNLGTLSFREVFAQIGTLDEGTVTLIALLLFAGAVGKSAQFPLHVWLPDAMEGPTPVSALIHAATMVNAGVYLVARANPIFVEAPTAMWVVASIGVFTAIFAAAIALTQNDIKKVLAYSTVSQLAYMFFALGIGAWTAAIFHLVSHGFFKGLLFMGSGSVIHGAGGEQDMRYMGNLRSRMRWTYLTMLIGSLALAGIPLFAGFFSKDEILAEAFNRGYLLFYAVGVIVAFMTAFYTFRMIFMTFWGPWRGPRQAYRHIHESVPTMVAPLLILAVPTVLAGLFLGIPPEGGTIHHWLEEVFHDAEEAGILPGSILSHGHEEFQLFGIGGLLLLIGAVAGTLGVLLAYRWYVRHPEAPGRFVERLPFGIGPGMYRASVNRYYVDELYELVFARGGVLLGNALWWFDVRVIDGVVNGAGGLARWVGGGVRRTQTGRVQNYGLGIAAGLVIVVLAYMTVVR
ncbi:MAG: NADH-quinone oxidoreductase subunit L [Candidatus Limnocylindria bacterium]